MWKKVSSHVDLRQRLMSCLCPGRKRFGLVLLVLTSCLRLSINKRLPPVTTFVDATPRGGAKQSVMSSLCPGRTNHFFSKDGWRSDGWRNFISRSSPKIFRKIIGPCEQFLDVMPQRWEGALHFNVYWQPTHTYGHFSTPFRHHPR